MNSAKDEAKKEEIISAEANLIDWRALSGVLI